MMKMKPELEKQLFKRFPKLFPKEDRGNTMKSLMGFGFECDDGWYHLIDNLCETIQSYIDANGVEQITVEQVKEKFGGLRFYYSSCGDELIRGMVWHAEHYSYHLCEMCGKPAEIDTTYSYVQTLCPKHKEQRDRKIKKRMEK